MNYTIINSNLSSTFKEITRRIERLQSGATIDSLQSIGATIEQQIGASYVSLKTLASHYEPDERLALLLWGTQKREEQIIACFLLPEYTDENNISQLTTHCQSLEIAGYLGSIFLSHYPGLSSMINEWLDSERPEKQVAILTALAKYFILFDDRSTIDKNLFKKATERKYNNKYVALIAERYRFNFNKY